MKNPFSNLFKKNKKEGSDIAPDTGAKPKKKGFLENFLKNRVGKKASQGEDVVGVELTPGEIRLAQLTSNKSNQWVLEKFFVHKVEGMPEGGTVLDNADLVGDQLKIALQKSKITTTNAAIAIPVTSAIIRVVTAPLMSEEELGVAIKSDSLWENLVQLTDNLADYSIFHQVINRDEKANTCLLYTSPSPRDSDSSRMPSSA